MLSLVCHSRTLLFLESIYLLINKLGEYRDILGLKIVFNDKPPCNIISSLVDVGIDGLLLSADVGANLEGLNLVVR